MRTPFTLATAIALVVLSCAGCSTNARSDAQASAPLPAPVDEKALADKALETFLASRSIREVPARQDALADLDGDGTKDLLMLLDDQNWCVADGCTLLVFHGGKDGYRFVGQSVSVQAPIAVGARINRGWHDLLVNVGGGGEAGTVALEFDGTPYPAAPAVADYRPEQVATQKIKKGTDDTLTLTLVKNPDIVASVAALVPKPYTVGFAAESENLLEYARVKLARKNLDLVVANNISDSSIGFNSDDNAVTLVDRNNVTDISQRSKQQLARELIALFAQKITTR